MLGAVGVAEGSMVTVGLAVAGGLRLTAIVAVGAGVVVAGVASGTGSALTAQAASSSNRRSVSVGSRSGGDRMQSDILWGTAPWRG